MNKTKLKTLLKSFLILFIFALAIQVSAVWAPPPSTPLPNEAPNNNIPPPVNVGIDPQMKNGPLGVMGIRAVYNPNTGAGGLGLFDSQIGIGSDSPGNPHMPTQPLDVLGNIKFSGALMPASTSFPAGNPGVDGQFLKSKGPNAAPEWVTGGGGMTNPMTTIGDMIYASATGTPATAERLGIGAAGDVLTVNSSLLPVWLPNGGNLWTRTLPPSPFYTYLTNSSDKVGIGTSAPAQQLQITKNFEIPNTNSSFTTGIIYKGGVPFLHDNGELNTGTGIKKQSIFIGANAGNTTSGGSTLSNNIGIGIEALKSITVNSPFKASGNVGIGNIALTNLTTGTNNVGVGASSIGSITTGEYNVGVGSAALSSSQATSTGNVGVGYNAGVGVSDGGTYIGAYACNANTSSSGTTCILNNFPTNSTAVGYQAKIIGSGITNATSIGYGARVDASNSMLFGNTSVVNWGFGVMPASGRALQVGSNSTNGNGAYLTEAGIWSSGSDRAKKHDISSIDYGLSEVMKLNPVKFEWNLTNQKDIGFIAQEVKPIIPEVVSGEEGSMGIGYGNITPVLVKAIQEQQQQIEELKKEIEILKNK